MKLMMLQWNKLYRVVFCFLILVVCLLQSVADAKNTSSAHFPPYVTGLFEFTTNEFSFAKEVSEFSIVNMSLKDQRESEGFLCSEWVDKYYCYKSIEQKLVPVFYQSAIEEYFMNTDFKFYDLYDESKRTWLSESYEEWDVFQKVVILSKGQIEDKVYYSSQLIRRYLEWSISLGFDNSLYEPEFSFRTISEDKLVLHKIFRFKLESKENDDHHLVIESKANYLFEAQ